MRGLGICNAGNGRNGSLGGEVGSTGTAGNGRNGNRWGGYGRWGRAFDSLFALACARTRALTLTKGKIFIYRDWCGGG